jgi:hypothetical protein
MPQGEFVPAIPVFERAKTVRALDCASTVIGKKDNSQLLANILGKAIGGGGQWINVTHLTKHLGGEQSS